MSPIAVGIVGCGVQGRLHAASLGANPDAEVVAVCDRDEARAGSLAAELGGAGAYGDHRAMLERHRLDLVTVCTMPDTHLEIVGDSLAAADVLCEKPMAHTLADAEAMAAMARESDRQLAIGFNLRHSSAGRAVRAWIEHERLGAPVCARGSMLETAIPWRSHHVKAVSGGGAIAATAIHMIDLLMWLAGNPRPLTATASMRQLFPGKRGEAMPEGSRALPYDVEDLAFGHVRFDSGFWLTIEGGWTWDAPGSECRFDFVGEQAQASAVPLRLWQERGAELRDVGDGASGDLDEGSSTAFELAEMVTAVKSGSEAVAAHPALATPQQALEVQAVVDALYRSAAAGREVEVFDVGAPEARA